MISVLSLAATSLSLSTDAFAAALARGSAARDHGWKTASRVGAVFGLSEGLMCLAGWLAARLFAPVIEAVDHWVALIVLLAIGGRMVWNGLHEDADDTKAPKPGPSLAGTILTALGTSVDAAAVGVALALTGGPAWTALVIGLTSFAVATTGYRIGPAVGARLGGYAEIVGGLVLGVIGVSIFLEHTLTG